MSKILKTVVATAVLVTAGLYEAPAQNSANVVAHCLSFQIQPLIRTDPVYGTVTAYFTTYTGGDLYPPLHDVSGANWVFSSEVRPLAGQPGVYGTDYLSFSSKSGLFQYGHMIINLPTTDSDNNGVPDFLQRENAANVSFSGYQTAIYPARASANLTGTLTRNAGQVQGQFSFNNGIVHPGNWNIPNLSGTMTYIRSNGVPIRLQLVGMKPDGTTRSWKAATSATVSRDAITFPDFSLTRDDNAKNQLAMVFTAQRIGFRYAGGFQFLDGLPDTSWADFTQWVIQITDPTDSNANGVPDLSDLPIKPNLLLTRNASKSVLSIGVQPAHSYTVKCSTDLRTWNVVTNFVSTGSSQLIRHNFGGTQASYRVSFP